MVELKFLNNFWKKKPFFFGIVIILLLLIGANYIFSLSSSKKKITPFVTFPSKGEYVHGQVVVAFRDGYIPKQLEKEIEDEKNKNFINRLGATLKNEKSAEEKIKSIQKEFNQIGIADYKPEFEGDAEKLNKFYILYYDSKIPIEEIQGRLKNLQFLESSEPNSVMHIFATPNDTYYSQLWGIQKIQAPQAWDITTGSDSITVADIDTGVDLSHPDLSANLVSGWNFINNTNNPQDDMGHGTHVAGIIGGIGNNGVGVVGVNWRVKIMPIKVMDSTGHGNATTIRQGIKYAADNGAKVVNLSLGSSDPCSSAYQNTVDYAISKGTILVIAAGNDNEDAANDSPGNCNGVITVGATDNQDQRSIWSIVKNKESNYGSTVEIAAPGTDILSTWFGGGYNTESGTSMATPHVAGAAALLLSANPSLSPAEVSKCLTDNADPISTDWPIGSRLNIYKAILACSGGPTPTLTPGVTPTLTPTPTLPPGATPTLIPTVTSVPARYTINVHVYNDNNNNNKEDSGDTPYQGATVNLTGSIPATSGVTDSSGNKSFTNLLSGNYSIRVTAPSHPAQIWSGFVNGNLNLVARFTNSPPLTPPVIITQPISPTLTITSVPTQTPVPTLSIPGSSPTPIPTPQTTYNCVPDPKCATGKKNLQLCPLICTPQ